MKKILVLLGICFCLPVFSANWQYIAKGKTGVKLYIDMDSLNYKGDYVYFWDKLLSPVKLKNKKTMRNKDIRNYTIVNCPKNLINFITSTEYNANGSVKKSFENSYIAGDYIYDGWLYPTIPESMGRIEHDFVCNYNKQQYAPEETQALKQSGFTDQDIEILKQNGVPANQIYK